MKALYVLLVLSTAAIVVALVAMLWRLRRHLHRSGPADDEALKRALQEMEPETKPEHESVEQR